MSGIVGQNLGRGSGLVKAGGVGADSVTSASIADDAIDSEHYVDASIDNAHLADDAVGLAEMASGTDGQIITYDASGNPTAVGPGSDGEVLTSTGAGSPPAFEAAGGFDVSTITGATALVAQPDPDDDEFIISDNGTLKRLDYKWLTNRNYFFAYMDGAFEIDNATTTKLQIDAVKDFGDGSSTAGLDTTNKRLVPTYAGYYFFSAGCRIQSGSSGNNLELRIKKNGSESGTSSSYFESYNTTTVTTMDYMNGSSDYVELFLSQNTGAARDVTDGSVYTYLLGLRLSGH